MAVLTIPTLLALALALVLLAVLVAGGIVQTFWRWWRDPNRK